MSNFRRYFNEVRSYFRDQQVNRSIDGAGSESNSMKVVEMNKRFIQEKYPGYHQLVNLKSLVREFKKPSGNIE